MELRSVASGALRGIVGINGTWASSVLPTDKSLLVTTVVLKDIFFTIGVIPVVIGAKIPITLGCTYQYQANANLLAEGQVSASFQGGFQYVGGKTSFITNASYSHSGGLQRVSLSGSASVAVYIMPVIQVNIQYIGGPSLSIKAYIEAGITTSDLLPSTDPCRFLPNYVGISANLGIQV